jgi:hypothetical protein
MPGPRSGSGHNVNILRRVGSERHDLGLEGCGDKDIVLVKACVAEVF